MRGGLHLVDGGDAEDFLDGGDALLDEPASGQSELETEHFGRLLRDLADLLRDTGEAYKRDAEIARTPDWQTAAVARASLYTTAWRAVRRMLRGGTETVVA